jgi:hypothetical protein
MLTQEQRAVVERARARITDPERWCRHQAAETIDGVSCDIDDPSAHRFCAIGALAVESLAVSADHAVAYGRAHALADELCLGRPSLAKQNDGPDGHAKVLAIFDKALAE